MGLPFGGLPRIRAHGCYLHIPGKGPAVMVGRMLHACPNSVKLVPLCRHTVYCSITACVKAANSRAAEGLTFRTGTASDECAMFQMIWAERMNPLGLRPERFTVATDSAGRLLGFGQLEQRDGYLELRSMIVVPAARCAGVLYLECACQTLPAPNVHSACRRQGVGRALLQQLLQRAGNADILLTTISSRIGFYAAAGFRQLERKEVPRCACMHARCRSAHEQRPTVV